MLAEGARIDGQRELQWIESHLIGDPTYRSSRPPMVGSVGLEPETEPRPGLEPPQEQGMAGVPAE